MANQSDVGLIWALSGGVTDPGQTKYEQGWIAEIPTYQNFNYVLQNTTTNIAKLAVDGEFDYDATVTYNSGAVVVSSSELWTCISDGTLNVTPSDNASEWTRGKAVTGNPSALTKNDGALVSNPSVQISSNVWDANSVTVSHTKPIISLKSANGALKNWLLSNISGTPVLIDVGTSTSPDGRDIALGASGVYKVYHEGNKPAVNDVSGAVEEAPQDGSIYGRKDGAWVKVTDTTVSETAPATAPSGQGWYNMLDGQHYTRITDIDDNLIWTVTNRPIIPAEYMAVLKAELKAEIIAELS